MCMCLVGNGNNNNWCGNLHISSSEITNIFICNMYIGIYYIANICMSLFCVLFVYFTAQVAWRPARVRRCDSRVTKWTDFIRSWFAGLRRWPHLECMYIGIQFSKNFLAFSQTNWGKRIKFKSLRNILCWLN